MSSIKFPKKSANNPADAFGTPTETPAVPAACSAVPPLAVRCDGRVLLATLDLESIDLSKREIWVGIVLTAEEAAAIHARVNFEEAASPTVGRLRAQDKKAKKATTDDDNNNNGSGAQ